MSTEFPNRREEDRRIFQSDCMLEPHTPSWTLLPKPLSGETVNITEHGVRVRLPAFEAQRYEKWFRHLEKGESIGLKLELHGGLEPIRVEGQIVWLGFTPENDDPGARQGELSVGILLGLLDSATLQGLRELIRRQQAAAGE